MNGNVIRTITIRGQAEGLDKLTADVNKLAAAQQNVAVVSEQSAKRVLSLEDAWKRQTLKLDEAARAQANIARETKLADQALREGIATQAQHAQRIEQINQRYTTLTTATKGVAEQTGLARHELINLGRQAQDVGVSLVSGQSPLMVLAQQGTQIADVFIASGKSVGSFFSQAVAAGARFFSLTGAIVTGIVAIGAAAVYAASQFLKSSTTIEQALENQNRLLKEGKALVDARTSAEARAQLQPKQLTEFEIARNLLDLQTKLNKEREAAERRVSRPTEVPGEMGAAPTGVAGVKEFAAAFDALNNARAAGTTGMKEFIAELGKVGTARPDLAATVEKMIELARTGIDLEQAEMRLRAISDAMKGVATNAQLAAVGLGSIAQFQVNNRQAKEVQEATERQAVATLQMAQAYPGMSIEVAKQLDAQKGQLSVAQAGIGLQQQEAAIAQANAQYEVTIRNLKLQGLLTTEQVAKAEGDRALALTQVQASQAAINRGADLMLQNLKLENAAVNATSEAEKAQVKGRQHLNELIEQGVDRRKAEAIVAQEISNAQDAITQKEIADAERAAADAARDRAQQNRQIAADMERQAAAANEAARRWEEAAEALKFIPFYLTDALGVMDKLFASNQGGKSQFNPKGYTSDLALPAHSQWQVAGRDQSFWTPQAFQTDVTEGMMRGTNARLAGGGIGGALDALLQGGGQLGGQSVQSQVQTQLVGRLTNLLPDEQKAGYLQKQIDLLQQGPKTLAGEEMLKQLTDQLKQLTEASKENTDALRTQADPLFSQGHEYLNQLKIGYYKAATGLSGIVSGSGGTDSTPVHMMLTPGEHIQVTPPGQSVANDNSKNVTQNITQNITINTTPADRLTGRQRAQGFIAAAARAVG